MHYIVHGACCCHRCMCNPTHEAANNIITHHQAVAMFCRDLSLVQYLLGVSIIYYIFANEQQRTIYSSCSFHNVTVKNDCKKS